MNKWQNKTNHNPRPSPFPTYSCYLCYLFSWEMLIQRRNATNGKWRIQGGGGGGGSDVVEGGYFPLMPVIRPLSCSCNTVRELRYVFYDYTMKIRGNTISIWYRRGEKKTKSMRKRQERQAPSLSTFCSTLQITVRVKRNNCMFLSPAPMASWRRSNYTATVWNTIGIQTGEENSLWFLLLQFEGTLCLLYSLYSATKSLPPLSCLTCLYVYLYLLSTIELNGILYFHRLPLATMALVGTFLRN